MINNRLPSYNYYAYFVIHNLAHVYGSVAVCVCMCIWLGWSEPQGQQGRSEGTAKLQDPCQPANQSKGSGGQPMTERLGGL